MLQRRRHDWIGDKPIAHRGLHDRANGIPENSRAAILAAAHHGYAIEFDVRLSGDGRVIVFHDPTLDRMCGVPGIASSIPAAELAHYRLQDTNEAIPLLSDILDALNPDVPLYIEAKHETRTDGRLEKALVADLQQWHGPAAIMSFEPSCLAVLRRIAPNMTRGIVSEIYDKPHHWPFLSAGERYRRGALLHLPRTQPHFISFQVEDFRRAEGLLRRTVPGLPRVAWTVRTPRDISLARAAGAQITFEGFLP